MTPRAAPALATAHAAALDDLAADGAGVPAWVHLIPVGEFSGRDGRGPYTLDGARLLAAFAAWGADLPVDYEHQGAHAEDNGQPAPAAGWIKALEVRDDGLWGRVEWTARATAMIAAREYRYLSPVFTYDPDDGRTAALLGAGLVNSPNLHLAALNARDAMSPSNPEPPMNEDLAERLRYLLNLPVTSTADDIAAELQKLIGQLKSAPVEAMRCALGTTEGDLPGLLAAAHARLSAPPDAALYVPRAEHEAVAHQLAELKTQAQAAAIAGAVDAALASGKVVPAQREAAIALCRTDLEAFKAFVAAAPEVAPAGEFATLDRAAASGPAPAAAFRAPAGFDSDADSLALHVRAAAWQAQHPNTDYLAAVRAVSDAI